MKSYTEFLIEKEIKDKSSGFEVEIKTLNPMLFDWQKVLVRWSLIRGRAALFEDCGLGKGLQQIEWAKVVSKHEQGPVMILAPLAVAEQMVSEGEKFKTTVNLCKTQADIKDGVNVTNYEKMHKFDFSAFPGVSCDESGILKHFSSATRNEIIEMAKIVPFRLAATATPAPNDHGELGNHAEYLGVMTRSEMLSTFFVNDTSDTGTWRLRGHVQDNIFWKWMSSWAVMMTKPSDLGYDDDGFILPAIHYHETILKSKAKPKKGFYQTQVTDLNDRRRVRRETMDERCQAVADLVNASDEGWLVWCELNPEGELLHKLIPGSIEVAGRHSDDVKTERLMGFAKGKYRKLVTKPKIAGHGMNFQVCRNAAVVGLTDSWESMYQFVRRIWRFGQKREVNIHIFMEEREGPIIRNIREKDKRAQDMIKNMIIHTKELTRTEILSAKRENVDYFPQEKMRLPRWI